MEATGLLPLPSEEILDSWKAIAAYLKRDLRTVIRWERSRGLPVHRFPGKGRSGVYALKSELDSWRRTADEGRGEPTKKSGPQTKATSIAVLPFRNHSEDKENDYFCDGLADEIIWALSRQPGLRVIARASSFACRGEDPDIREVGGKLNAQMIVAGSVRRAGARIRVTAQLIDAAISSRSTWASTRCGSRGYRTDLRTRRTVVASPLAARRSGQSSNTNLPSSTLSTGLSPSFGLDSIYVYIRILSEVLFRLGRQYSTASPGTR